MICGGDMEVFIEPLLQTPTVFIFGAGHIAYALSKMAVLVGFKVVVVDDRPGYATPGRFPEASRVLTVDFSSSFSELAIDRSGYIVIVTYGHQNDAVVLEQALNTPARYIGMIGSNTKNEAVYTALKAQGVSQQQIERVYAPIGVPIRAHTPEEIAVSILGQMILVKRSD
jgi:xanthine dehydrogenase accessory factor